MRAMLSMVALTMVATAAGGKPFEGAWKLNAAQSRSQQQVPDAVLTIRSVPEGLEFRFARVDGKSTPRVTTCHVDDGEHPLSIPDGRHQTHTSTCRKLNDRTVEQVINHDNGKMMTTTRAVVSDDGRTLRETWSGHNDKGEKIDLVYVYDRQ
jgi:hypothetical protein